jgi:hypothetical protein
MPKLNDTQLVLLTTASQREDGSILPAPDTLTSPPAQIRKALQALTKKGLVNEVEVRTPEVCWREEDDRRLGLAINDAGRAAIGVGDDDTPPTENAGTEAEPPTTNAVRAGTKQALLLELIQRSEGASLSEVIEATGWLAHSARAAITGLRKRGHDIELEKVEGASCYRCNQAVA